MKIGIIGGTGDIGQGMAMRLSQHHTVLIGSRDDQKACEASECVIQTLAAHGIVKSACAGDCNQGVVDEADVIILAIPFKHLTPTLTSLSGFEGKIVVSPINPIARGEYFFYDPPEEGSAALLAKTLLPESANVVSAFNNIAANLWKQVDRTLTDSVAVCGDDESAKRIVIALTESIPELRAFDAGPLAVSSIVESITPLLLNIARYNRMKDVGIQFR